MSQGTRRLAAVMLTLGRKEEGYGCLRMAFEERDPSLLYFNSAPWIRELRKDPR